MTRRGFALAAVLFALTILGALAAAGLFVAWQDMRAAHQARDLVRARGAAQSAIAAVLAGWDVASLNVLRVGAAASVVPPVAAGTVTTARVHRLNARLFLVAASARAAGGAEVVALQPALLDALETTPAALRTRQLDPALVGRFDGTDRGPPGWSCPAPFGAEPALILQPALSDSLFFRFGRKNWSEAAAWAAAAPAGGDSLEVRYASGDLTLNAGRVIGTLVVEGDLIVRGGVEIIGLVLIRGALRLDGSGGRITGAVVASQVVAQNGFVASGDVAAYSSCAVLAAALSRAVPRVVVGVSSVPLH